MLGDRRQAVSTEENVSRPTNIDFGDEDDGPVPGPAEFHRFYWSCMALKSELNELDYALRTIGSSASAIHAANKLKHSLRVVRDLFGINTSSLFPDDPNVRMYKDWAETPIAHLSKLSPAFSSVADALSELIDALQGFGWSYHDEGFMIDLWSLHRRFRQEARTTLKMRESYTDIRKYKAMQREMQFLLDDLLETAVEKLTGGLVRYCEKGVPAIKAAQRKSISQYLQLTTVATFLAGVTASMLQVSSSDTVSATGPITNTLFLLSLITSVGSAVHSLLLIGWKSSVIDATSTPLPNLINLWFTSGPNLALLLSASLFSVALCSFSFSSGQQLFTSSLAIAASAFYALGLLFMFTIVIIARIGFRRKSGKLGQKLTRDDTILKIIDMVYFIAYQPLRKLQRERKEERRANSFSATRLGSDTMLKPIDTIFTSGHARKSSSLSVNEDYTIVLVSPLNDTSIPNALSDETHLLDATYIHYENGTLTFDKYLQGVRDGDAPVQLQEIEISSLPVEHTDCEVPFVPPPMHVYPTQHLDEGKSGTGSNKRKRSPARSSSAGSSESVGAQLQRSKPSLSGRHFPFPSGNGWFPSTTPEGTSPCFPEHHSDSNDEQTLEDVENTDSDTLAVPLPAFIPQERGIFTRNRLEFEGSEDSIDTLSQSSSQVEPPSRSHSIDSSVEPSGGPDLQMQAFQPELPGFAAPTSPMPPTPTITFRELGDPRFTHEGYGDLDAVLAGLPDSGQSRANLEVPNYMLGPERRQGSPAPLQHGRESSSLRSHRSYESVSPLRAGADRVVRAGPNPIFTDPSPRRKPSLSNTPSPRLRFLLQGLENTPLAHLYDTPVPMSGIQSAAAMLSGSGSDSDRRRRRTLRIPTRGNSGFSATVKK